MWSEGSESQEKDQKSQFCCDDDTRIAQVDQRRAESCERRECLAHKSDWWEVLQVVEVEWQSESRVKNGVDHHSDASPDVHPNCLWLARIPLPRRIKDLVPLNLLRSHVRLTRSAETIDQRESRRLRLIFRWTLANSPCFHELWPRLWERQDLWDAWDGQENPWANCLTEKRLPQRQQRKDKRPTQQAISLHRNHEHDGTNWLLQ